MAGTLDLVVTGMSHKYWNPFDEPTESFEILYGDGLNE